MQEMHDLVERLTSLTAEIADKLDQAPLAAESLSESSARTARAVTAQALEGPALYG
jgi:hypothetical protein